MIIAWLVLTRRWDVCGRYDLQLGEFVGSAALAAFEVIGEVLMLAFFVGML